MHHRQLQKTAIALLFCTLFSGSSFANTVYGGGVSCGTVASEAADYDTGAVHMTYTMGLISGLNIATNTTWNNAPDPQGIWQALVLYCQQNPLTPHREAIMEIYGQIMVNQ